MGVKALAPAGADAVIKAAAKHAVNANEAIRFFIKGGLLILYCSIVASCAYFFKQYIAPDSSLCYNSRKHPTKE
jgi:hypothetical protein